MILFIKLFCYLLTSLALYLVWVVVTSWILKTLGIFETFEFLLHLRSSPAELQCILQIGRVCSTWTHLNSLLCCAIQFYLLRISLPTPLRTKAYKVLSVCTTNLVLPTVTQNNFCEHKKFRQSIRHTWY